MTVTQQPCHQDIAADPAPWGRLLVVLCARAYRAMLLTLTVIAISPLALGWQSYTVESASMKPSIAVGDVVLAKATADDHRVDVGRVYVFDDPTRADRVLVHRVVEKRDDGSYTTAGDANATTDAAPLETSDIRAQAVLLTPFVGLPVHWLRSGDWLMLGAWLMVTVIAFVLAASRAGKESRPSGRSSGRRSPGLRRPYPARRAVAAALTGMVAVTGLTTISASAAFTDRTGSGSNQWRAGSWVQPYLAAVLADRPFGVWLLDERDGVGFAADRSGNDRTGQYYQPLDTGRPGGLPRNPGTAATMNGGRVVLGPATVSAPSEYSIELWFRTTSRAGGYIAGFENDRDDSWFGATADRMVVMEGDGRLTFGRWSIYSSTITTPRAYNDGTWHHLVVTSRSNRASTIYVDGQQVAAGTTSPVSSYSGLWRVGQGSTGFFHGLTSSFAGDIDNVSVYHSVLSAARVSAHWAAR